MVASIFLDSSPLPPFLLPIQKGKTKIRDTKLGGKIQKLNFLDSRAGTKRSIKEKKKKKGKENRIRYTNGGCNLFAQ